MLSDLHEFLSHDHKRLDQLFAKSLQKDDTIDHESYDAFRRGLLWHIGIEEKLLFPIIRREQGESELVRQLHRDHAALAALLMPPPNRKDLDRIREILDEHNPLEEEAGGLYEIMEKLAGDELSALMEKVRSFPAVRLAPHMETEVTRWSIERLIEQAEEGRRRLK